MSVVVNASSRTGGGEPSQGVLRFAPVNALRWARGKAQRNWPPSLLLGVAINALLALALMALVVWLAFQFGLGLKGLDLAQLWHKAMQAAVGPQMALALAAWLLQPVAQRALQTRELRLSAQTLELRYAWPWLNRWLGWRVRLDELNPTLQVLPTRPSPDPLSQLSLTHKFNSWSQTLSLADWAPLRSGKAVPGNWPPASHPPSRSDVFFMRASRKLTSAQQADLQARALQLPLGHALAERGVALRVKPGPRTPGGQLDLTRVPELKLGLVLLALFAVVALLMMLATKDWHFFRAPIGLFAGLSLLSASLLAWLLWPKGDLGNLDEQDEAGGPVKRSQAAPASGSSSQRQRVLPQPARPQLPLGIGSNPQREGRTAALFMALICGALVGWVLICALVLLLARGPLAAQLAPQAFTLDLGHMPMGPIVLKAEQAGVPDIHSDSNARFWESQTHGQRYELPAARIGPWWVYDARPLIPAMQRFYGR